MTGLMDRLGQLAQAAQSAPRATLAVPLLLVQVAMVVAVLAMLGPAIFLKRREPFERLMQFLELVLGWRAGREGRPSRRRPPRPRPPATS
jgi:hypothetical protein